MCKARGTDAWGGGLVEFGDLAGFDDLPDLDTLDDLPVDGASEHQPDALELPDPFSDAATPDGGLLADEYGLHEPFEPMWMPTEFDGFGDPLGLEAYWSLQEQFDTCAVVSQGMVLDAITGESVSQSELVEVAEANGWYRPGEGTPVGALGELLEHHGIDTTTKIGADLSDLAVALENDDHSLVALNASEITDPLRDTDGVPVPQGGADHAVWVTGIDVAADGTIYVIVNDPGHSDGAAFPVASDDFLNAWGKSNNHLVIADVDSWEAVT